MHRGNGRICSVVYCTVTVVYWYTEKVHDAVLLTWNRKKVRNFFVYIYTYMGNGKSIKLYVCLHSTEFFWDV